MKIINSLYVNQKQVFTSKKHETSNSDFEPNSMELVKNSKGEKCARVDIYDTTHLFKLTDEVKDAQELDTMIDNIKKTLTGFFVRSNNQEYFVPYILNKVPDVLNQQHIVENGNAETVRNEESQEAFKIIQSYGKAKFSIKKLKTIKYLERSFLGYSNNTSENAFSYFDKPNNILYLYIPKNKTLQILTNENYVRNIKFEDASKS